MATDLQQTLRSLCFHTEWKYAVFWKLKHRTRMVLTWEDAYYDNYDSHDQHDPLEDKCFSKTPDSFHDGHYSHDALGLAVAKMSYHVYSLGEGIVGQVAVTGKHQWIFSDKHTTNSSSSFEYCDGWQAQFSAGIKGGQHPVVWISMENLKGLAMKGITVVIRVVQGMQLLTIVVVAVVPHGVVQLGSLQKVVEDLKMVSHIKDVFFALQDSSVAYIPHPIQCSMKSSLAMSDISTRSSASDIVPDSLFNLDKGIHKERPNVWSPMFPIFGKHNDSSYIFQLPGIHQDRAVNMFNKDGGLELSSSQSDESTKFLQPRSENLVLEGQKRVQMKLISNTKREGETSGWRDANATSEHNDTSYPYNSLMENINSFSTALAADKSQVDFACFPFGFFDSVDFNRVKLHGVNCHENGVLRLPDPSDMQLQKDLEKKLEFSSESSHVDTTYTSLRFSAGSELHEALGPAFLKQSNYCDWETEKAETETTIELPEGMSSSQLTSDSGSENLLEAVVAKVCQSGSDVKSEKSFCQSMQSLLTTEKIPEPSSHTIHTVTSAGYSINQSSLVEETQNCLKSSEVCGVTSPQGISSICPSSCSEQLERSAEPSKVSKKRARPGESSRPRPRDRQLIQDRIKELRELVPNGSKIIEQCSIDSLLERTIKHMLFLQSITKHADKLNKCAESKLHGKETGVLGSSSYEQGSSWAVEVGSHMKVCPIIVENLNMDGQMVVEMLCEECSRFLEIAEAIRSLGLTILKGVTEARGEKTWICFVVEGQNNRNMRRMDILWSLVQILQPKPTM